MSAITMNIKLENITDCFISLILIILSRFIRHYIRCDADGIVLRSAVVTQKLRSEVSHKQFTIECNRLCDKT